MDDIYGAIIQRNARETLPFVSFVNSNKYLETHVDALSARCESLERQYLVQQQVVAEQALAVEGAPAKNESRLRDKIAALQEDLKQKIESGMQAEADALLASKELLALKEDKDLQDAARSNLQMELDRCNEINSHTQRELENSKELVLLAQQQIDQLKDSIRVLQEENEEKTKLSERLINEKVTQKEKEADHLAQMTDMIEALKKENGLLKQLAKDAKSKGLLGNLAARLGVPHATEGSGAGNQEKRQWGQVGAILPSQPQWTIKSHRDDASCVRYDGTNQNKVATASSDATVKVFDTSSGQLESSFSAGGRLPLLGVDIAGDVVCACGADKTCRVWNQKNRRMIHQLAGHSQKITCVRLFPGEKSVVTGSADRSIRVWDISRHIYSQSSTLRHSSTTNSIDVSYETQTVASGHLDGGLRCWDVKSGDRVLDLPSIHDGGLTSVQWNPRKGHELLTAGRDSTLKIVDARTKSVVKTFCDKGLKILSNQSSSSFSPDGAYVAAGSGDSGDVLVFNVSTGELEKRICGAHKCGVVGLSWSPGGSNGQQVATVDKSGILVLWA
mmetsp:Transcript_28224/g.67253  ORF Transcript_28224/g.67253 Transcript_28224/m.67253 type:complete len:560 (-) Transcript_28224:542-2221(-)